MPADRTSVQPTDFPPNRSGGTGPAQLEEPKRRPQENERLRRAGSDLTLDKLFRAAAARGNFIGSVSPDQWRTMSSSLASARLVAGMIELARRYGRYGYRRGAALLRVNDKRVERLWKRERPEVPIPAFHETPLTTEESAALA